ncbi:MAG: amidase [Gammaproteobacteria bacterium]|nr:amidase [Gammaproteobacteria bacterium]
MITGKVRLRGVIEIAEAVRRRELRASDVLEDCLQALATINPQVNACVLSRADLAREEAVALDRRIQRGEDPGPLAGVPFGVKDLEDIAGLPTTQGSLLLKQAPPASEDSVHVERLRAAGAIAIGKTNVCEFGVDSSTYNRLWGVTRNPWNLQLTPGGSSGGSSAAVAAGIVPLATATDASGSTREPASFTGLVGLKPSHGRIPRSDGFANWATHGALTRSVADTARYLDAVAGPDDRDRQSLPANGTCYERVIETLDVAGLRTVWSADLGYAVVEPEVVDLAHRAARTLVAAGQLRWMEHDLRLVNARDALGIIMISKARDDMTLSGLLPHRLRDLGAQFQHWLEKGKDIGPAEVAASWRTVRQLEREMAALFLEADVLLTPAVACVPYPADAMMPEVIDGRDASRSGPEPFGLIANIAWNPSISVPAGLTKSGLPVGLQITVKRHRDDVALRLARILEHAQPWHFPWALDA